MGFNEGGFNGDGYGGFKRISVKKKVDLNPKISENISAAITEVDADLTEVFYTTKSVSETVSASLAVTVSLTSV